MPSLTKVQSGFMEAQGALPLSSGTAAAPGLKFDDHAGTGMFSPSTGEIAFSTSSHQQALTLDTAGRLGIGASNNTSYDTNAQTVLIASGGNTGMTIRSAGSTPFAMIHFADGTSGDSQKRAGRIMYQHDGDNLTFHTANIERLRINGSGSIFSGSIESGVETSYAFKVNAGGLYANGSTGVSLYLKDGSTYPVGTWNDANNQKLELGNGASSSWQKITLDGSNGNATFAGDMSIQDSSYLRIRLTGSNTSTAIQLGPDGGATFAAGAFAIESDGDISTNVRCHGHVELDSTGGFSSPKIKLFSNTGAITASTVNLQSSATSSWFQTGTSIGSYSYVWAAKNSSSNVWHSGLQTDGDLYLGGNLAASNNIALNGSNGSGWFTGSLTANPLSLTSSNGWIRSSYGAITNSTVSSLNNLMIAQNIRGYIQSIDGGGANNNFYSVLTHSGMGYAGTEYCYGGITKFYNGTGASTANNTVSPSTSMQINGSGIVTKPNNPSFQVSRNQASWTVAASTKFDWDLVAHNIGSHFSLSNDRFTAPVTGTYQFNFSIIWYHTTLLNEWVSLRKNGSRFTGGDVHFSATFGATKWDHVAYSASVYLTSGDYVEMFNGGGAIYYHGSTWAQWSGYLVG